MKQAQEFQKNMTKIQQEIEELTVESSVGGGVVKASVSGKMELESITISPEVIDSEDMDMVQDLICLLYTSPSPRDGLLSRMPSSA